MPPFLPCPGDAPLNDPSPVDELEPPLLVPHAATANMSAAAAMAGRTRRGCTWSLLGLALPVGHRPLDTRAARAATRSLSVGTVPERR